MSDSRPAKRAERIQAPSILLPFRAANGSITNHDVWREDILEWQPDDRFPASWYLVLDFGVEQSLTIISQTEFSYIDTGRIQLDLQPLRIDALDEWDPQTTEGLGPPVARFADVPTAELGDLPGDEPRAGRPMVGWTPRPVSPRRP